MTTRPPPPDKTIIVRTPLRIPLGGEGTDLPSYYTGRGGFFVVGAIDKYVTVTLAPPNGATSGMMGNFERRVLDLAGAGDRQISWTSDVPPRFGLGFSGALTVGILYALWTESKKSFVRRELVERAYQIEQQICPVGCHDHFAAVHGGVVAVEIDPLGSMTPTQVVHSHEGCWLDWLALYSTGVRRSILSVFDRQTVEDRDLIADLDEIKAIGRESFKAMEAWDRESYAVLMKRHWEIKRRSPGVSNAELNQLLAATAWTKAGKLTGAGGGGCALFVTYPGQKPRCPGMRRIDFRWGWGVH